MKTIVKYRGKDVYKRQQQQFMELMEKNDVYGGEFLKIVCKIKEYILSKYKTDASLYCGKNLDLLLKKDKKLYEYAVSYTHLDVYKRQL